MPPLGNISGKIGQLEEDRNRALLQRDAPGVFGLAGLENLRHQDVDPRVSAPALRASEAAPELLELLVYLDENHQLITRFTGPDLRRWSLLVAVDLEGLGHIGQLGLEIIVEAANLHAGRYRRLQLYVFLEPAPGAGGDRNHSHLLFALSEAVLYQEHDLEAVKDHVQFTLHGECDISRIDRPAARLIRAGLFLVIGQRIEGREAKNDQRRPGLDTVKGTRLAERDRRSLFP